MRLKLPQDEYVERATYRATYRQGQTTRDGERQRQRWGEGERGELDRGGIWVQGWWLHAVE